MDIQQGDTLSYILYHEDNEHWWLAEDSKGHVGYVPVSHLMIIIDETIQEEECDKTRKEVQGKSTDGTKIGGEKRQEGERRMKYSTAVVEGIKRNATTYVGDYIVRKTDARLNKGEDVVVYLPGARIEHVTERVEKIVGRGKGGTRNRTLDMWICVTALWGEKECTRGTVCTLVGRGLPPLPRDCQGRLPVDWVKYDI